MEGELEVAWKRIGDSGDGPFSLSRSGWKKEGNLKWEGRTARWGWCWSLAEAALIRSHVLCKEARVVSWERGRWQMERILP